MQKIKFPLGGLVALLLWLGSLPQPGLAAAPATAPLPPSPHVLRADTTGLTLEWAAPTLPLAEAPAGHELLVAAPGWDWERESGWPALPVGSVLLVAPPAGTVNLRTTVMARRSYPLAGFSADPLSRRLPTPEPEPAWVTWEEAGRLRGWRLLRLVFRPAHYAADGATLTVAEQVQVTVTFNVVAGGHAMPVPDDPFAALVQQSVINPEQAAAFTAYGPATPSATGAPTTTQYLIISHANFITAVTPLATHRALSDGLRVYLTTTQAIQSLFVGVPLSTAIRSYISATYHSSSPPVLRYVLLVGDGSERATDLQYVPPYLIPDPWSQLPNGAASDNRYVTMDGPTDQLADIFIGRLPVNTITETTTVIQKILAYDFNPPPWPWNQRVLIFAGHQQTGETFHADADSIYNTLPLTMTGIRAYYCTSNCQQSYQFTDINVARGALLNGLKSGGLLAFYVGHGSQHQWDVAPDTYAPLFHLDHVAQLNNGGALPFFLSMTCFTGRFSDPAGPTLDETLLRRPDGGAIATWGGTTLGNSSGHRQLQQAFFTAVFQQGLNGLGEATEAAKLKLVNNFDLRDTFILLGDPATRLNRVIVPWQAQLYLPLVLRNSTP